jgi:hypothetical protein
MKVKLFICIQLKLTCHEGAEGEWSYGCTLFFTSSSPDEGGFSKPCPSHFTPGNDPVPIVEAGGTPGLVWTGAE